MGAEMGCDIHIWAEVRRDGRWWLSGLQLPDDRNYDLFAILADIRNGIGFAGVPTGDGFEPIAPPRGVPADASPGYLAHVRRWEADGHSHSWFTLRELWDYDWRGRETTLYGVVSAHEYERMRAEGATRPLGDYAGDIRGPGVVVLEAEDYDAARDRGGFVPTDGTHVRVRWRESYEECCRAFLAEALPRLAELAPPDDVRIVFFFDN